MCVHLLLLNNFPQSAYTINKATSLLTQLLGGLLILYSIDTNIGVINQKSLLAIFAAYFKEFPLIKRSITLNIQGALHATSSLEAKLTVGRNPKSIDEKIEYLQDQINDVKRDIEQEAKKLNERIERQSKYVGARIQETQSALRNLESKMDEVSIGGVKVQLFGVLLMVYGAIAGYVA